MTRTLGALLATAAPPPNIATGVDVGADGTIYFSANKNNAIYRVRPMR
jgi:glucose/arabinose dehydrogenase